MTTSRRGSSLSISTFHISSDEEDDEDEEEEETSARAFSRYSSLNFARASFSAGVNAETSGDDDDDDIVGQREFTPCAKLNGLRKGKLCVREGRWIRRLSYDVAVATGTQICECRTEEMRRWGSTKKVGSILFDGKWDR
jgi:hypothetical protein